ncbi:CDP-alcohol phosphatidyltransferase family protein [Cellulomonas carbonis]|uniref:CDP-diacylglycerol--glycerol-3-phosphate 3-phosphatidyltransferase n=1 Tax=Cellulomonas carbonis T26 TaxID=947969 RepID=A0A0A0BX85_9CELL|nr:CDP-alcohol phosphatidyltransferase family protein [Cellulomonas carbonis]KGM11739.1 CDP-diacylglycerol--glycerol-3-phosphate 3-phosphatidyltransferase [Cellulomonas carbonis T26]GGB94612.1 CDP-diacylglycerol--glycerol-3-phosphate 3-phosphatidyltransferase [Cellulomonas carbonis]
MTEVGTPADGPGAAAQVSSRVLTLPNVISAVRLLLVPVFAVLLLRGEDAWALGVLAFSGATDWLDGTLARRLGQQSRLGELLDPAADRLFILVTLVVLTARDVVPTGLLVAVVGRDLLLVVVLAVLMASHVGPLPVHVVGKSGTFALLYAFPLLLLAEWSGTVGLVAGVVGWAFAWWGMGLYWLAGGVYVWQAWTELRRRRATA